MIHITKTNSLFFRVYKSLYYRKYKSNPNLTDYKEELKKLELKGVVVIHNFIEKEIVDKIKNEIFESINQVKEGNYKGKNKFYRFQEYGVYRLLDIEKISKTSLKFFDHPLINSLAKAYVSDKVTSFQRMAELKPDIGINSVSDIWHIDDWKYRFKSFLYLTDVAEENCPFVYMPGTHKQLKWKNWKEYEYYKYGKKRTYGYFLHHEVANLKNIYGLQEKICTGAAGTLILADTRGLHRGSTLRSGQRMLLANYFDVRK